jgi:deazaflavin-dependent oxidoreductase (nitroreductase family)
VLRRAGSVAGALLLAVAALVAVVVLGIRAKYPPVLNRVRRLARDVGNPQQLRSAGTPGASASILRHTGRKSGAAYETPVTAVRTVEGFVIALPYGSNTDWLKNVIASGSATLAHQGNSYQVDGPEVVPSTEAARDFSARERRTLRLLGVDECLRLHRTGPVEVPGPG